MESLLPGEAVVVQLIFINAHRLLLKHPPTQSHRNGQLPSLSKLLQIQSHNQPLASFKLQAILQSTLRVHPDSLYLKLHK